MTQMQVAEPHAFRQTAVQIATSLLSDWVGDERSKEAAGRITAALSASAAAARDPRDYYACTPQSIGTCIALAALTGLMPGTGSTALAYVYPRRPRKGEAPQLQYSLSHRGINAVARRCGQTMIAIPIGVNDAIAAGDGEIVITSHHVDDPPTSWEELKGVVVIVKELSSGLVIHRGYVPRKLIEKRRAMSLSDKSQFSPWQNWPVEMAIKTALHYAVARGWCVIDDTEATRALSADQVDVSEPSSAPLLAPAPAKDKADELADRLGAPMKVCDGQHAMPACADPNCWHNPPPQDQAAANEF